MARVLSRSARPRPRRAAPNRKHRITAINFGDGTWSAACSTCGRLGTGSDVYVSYIVAIHQGNNLPS
jgi:hypothetical protein